VTTQPSEAGNAAHVLDDEALDWIRVHLAADSALLRRLIKLFAEHLMAADADRLCRADPDGGERVNRRNGYRIGAVETQAGTVQLNVPRLRRGGYTPRWLFDAVPLASDAIEEAACRAFVEGVTTESVSDLVVALDMSPLPSPRLADVAAALGAAVDEERHRPLSYRPYPEVWLVAYTWNSGRRIRPRTARLGVGSHAHGDRQVLGATITDRDEETGWRNLLRQFVARGLRGVAVVKSDAWTAGQVRAVQAELPEAVCEGPMIDAASPSWAESYVWAPSRAGERPRPTIVIRDRGRGRGDVLPPTSQEPVHDLPSVDRHERPRRRGVPVLAGAIALVIVAVALAAALWRNTSDPARPVRPPTTTVASPTSSGVPAQAASAPVAAAPTPPSTLVTCSNNAGAYTDVATAGDRAPWLQQVLCAATAGR
jgi:hypothetical protein